MDKDSIKNYLLFFACALAMILVYNRFVLEPAARQRQAEASVAAVAASSTPAVPAVVMLPRAQALAASPRVRIDSPGLLGSIALRGARIDDLSLKGYSETLAKDSPLVALFRPEGSQGAYFTTFGWTGANLQGLPSDDTLWTAPAGAVLSPANPVSLTYLSPQGLLFTRTIAVDKDFMFTVSDTVANQGAAAAVLAPYASVLRQGLPDDLKNAVNVHQGALGWLGDSLMLSAYPAWKKKGEIDQTSRGGWLGITDKYWMAALIPDQHEQVHATFRVTPASNVDIYDASFLGAYRTIAPGQQVSATTRLFAGAKTVPLLQAYTRTLGVPEFDRAVDWGWLWFLTRPVFWVLEFFYQHVGNFGVAILLLTVCVRVLLFWPNSKSYESMTKMKKVQPELEKLRARNKDDPAKQQQEMMALYQREKINPFLGCLPMFATIPVFLSLFKVLSVTIEMRHAQFGWIKDLSDRDPTTLWNLFGLIPYHPAALPLIGSLLDGTLHVGVWALLYGFTMWLTTAMSPQTGMDATQQKIMQFMPLIFTFVMARFAVGLLIYYTWSNVLSLIQQYVIMRRFKVDNPIDSFIRRLSGLRAKPSG